MSSGADYDKVEEGFERLKAKQSANNLQVSGNHYKSSIQHWDLVAATDMNYFQGNITKYVTRFKKKNGLEDIKKALHYLDKYIELRYRGVFVSTEYTELGGVGVLTAATLAEFGEANMLDQTQLDLFQLILDNGLEDLTTARNLLVFYAGSIYGMENVVL